MKKIMPNKNKSLLVVTLFASICCGLAILRSEQTNLNVVTAQTQSPRLSLELSKSQENHLRAEPISFTLKLSNQTNQSISWKGNLNGGSSVNLIATNADGVVKRFDGNNYMTPRTYMLAQVMQPGEQVQVSLLLEIDLLDELFSNPGLYNFQVEFTYDTGLASEPQTRIASNSISINVLQPQGINLQAYQYIRERLGTSSYELDTRAVAELRQEFVNRFRNSVYGKYMIVRLGESYQTLGEDAKALRELCKVSGENFHHARRVEKTVLAIDRRLNPSNWVVPEGVPLPILRHPCTRISLN